MKKVKGVKPHDLSLGATFVSENRFIVDAILAGYESDSSLIEVLDTDYDD